MANETVRVRPGVTGHTEILPGKSYRVIAPEPEDPPEYLRIIDESEEDYLYPIELFEERLTATVTSRGGYCSLPPDAETVGATVHLEERELGKVVLLVGSDGNLHIWGYSMDMWASDELVKFLHDCPAERRDEMIDNIVVAVQQAAQG